jgi:SAM-dependent methyltransferase
MFRPGRSKASAQNRSRPTEAVYVTKYDGKGNSQVNDDVSLIYKNDGNMGLLDLLPSSPGAILDCGCGAGDNARILRGRGWRVTGVTIDPQEQKVAEPFCEVVHIGDLERGLPAEIDGTFDAILASHVLEHLAAPERLLDDIRARLSHSGVLVVALPNIAHYRQRLSFLRGHFDYTEAGQLDHTHLRFYTYSTAIQLLERSGYEVTSMVVEGTLPWWKARGLIPANIVIRVDRWAASRMPNLLGYQTLMLARPRRVTTREVPRKCTERAWVRENL